MTDKPIKYIDGRELMERWGVGLTALIQYCDGYIQAYKKDRPKAFPIYTPPTKEKPHINGSIIINANTILVPYALPDEHSITGCFFLIDEIEAFERKNSDVSKRMQQKKQVPTGIVIDGTAPEYLRIAAEAWETLYKSGAHLKWKGGHKNNITSWIKKKYPDIKDTAAQRIAQIININPNGGAPRT
jgi:hypothetical protein